MKFMFVHLFIYLFIETDVSVADYIKSGTNVTSVSFLHPIRESLDGEFIPISVLCRSIHIYAYKLVRS